MAQKDRYELRKKSRDPSYKRKEGNLPAKKYKHSNPTELRMVFEGVGSGTEFIDLAMCLSTINRKAARQSGYWYVNSVELYNNTDSFVDLHVLPDTWTTRNAYIRAKAIWDQTNETALKHQSGILPKYHDFKVYMSDRHRTTGSKNPVVYDINGAGTAIVPDEWDYSRIVTADDDGDANQDSDKFYLHMLGGDVGTSDDWTSIGVIKSYAKTRARNNPTTPQLATSIEDDALTNVFDYSSEEQLNEIVELLDSENDSAPYDHDGFLGEGVHMQHVARLATSSIGGRVTMAAGFCAPLGLICIDPDITTPSEDTWRLVVNLAPGTYHGAYVERV